MPNIWDLEGKERMIAEYENETNDLFDRWTQARQLKDQVKRFLSLVPDAFYSFVKGKGYITLPWNKKGLLIYVPYILEDEKKIKYILTAAGFVRHHETSDNKNMWVYYRHPDFDEPWQITINLDATRQGSKCVLVPIEWETVTRAKTLDKICPETHPDLFKEIDGKLEYVGDNLFPKPPDGIKI
jgi:hypothetical protein